MCALKTNHLFDLTFVSDPAISPDGQRGVAVHTVILPGEGTAPPRYRGNLFLYDLSSGEARQLTFSSHGDSHPRFSPDGERLAFLARKGEQEKPQLYVLEFAGGEARRLTEHAAGVTGFAWHPKGDRIAYVSRGDYDRKSTKDTVQRVITRSTYLSDAAGFRPDVPAQLYLLDIATGESDQLTDGSFDAGDPAFSPSGRVLYYLAASSERDEADWKRDLFALKLKSGKTARLLPEPMGIAEIVPSPNGQSVLFFAPADPAVFASPASLWRVASRGGPPERLTDDLDVTPAIGGDSRYGAYPNRAAWATSGKAVYFNVNRSGKSALCRLDLTSRELAPLMGGKRAVTGFAAAADTLLFTAETTDAPGELFVWRDGAERAVSALNRKLSEKRGFRNAETVRFETDDGAELEYWVMTPAKPRKDKAVVVQVHGGPHTNYGYGFSFEFQLLAARGFTVVYGNPRGSSGYGHDFATTILGRYGTVDAADVLAMTEHALTRHTDPDAPVHLTGGSYGGFMTNWLVTQTPRFRSAVTQRSICNWLSFYGTSDIGQHFTETEQGGTPWDDTLKLWDQSPLKHVAKVKTPLLILHSEADYRCPVEQAEQFFAALMRLGNAPTKFIRFPEENHELSRSGRPDRRIARLEAIVGWFEEHA